jgi:TrmH family RNA methyltransferase
MKANRSLFRVVLVRPRNPLNIGAAARAMANFGLRELMVVAPHPPVWQETRSAVGAEEIVRSAVAVEYLSDAIGDRTWVVGTTSGSRRNLDRELVSLTEPNVWLPKRARRGRIALLFGSEKTGLSNEEMSFCHTLVRIPTSEKCSSMNLGQAVAVCCYELVRDGAISSRQLAAKVHYSGPANLQSMEHVLERAARVFEATGYLQPKSRPATLIKLRRLLMDLELTNNDVKILGGILAQIEWKLASFNT